MHCKATTTTVSAKQLASIYHEEVFRHHGLPESIVSDRDPRFTSDFWKALMGLCRTDLKMSTSFHPQTDGQTEKQNQTLETMLRAYTNYNQNDWDDHLVAAEFYYNDSKHSSTQHTPFYLNSLQHPRSSIDLAFGTIKDDTNPAAADMVQRLHDSLALAKECLTKAIRNQAHYANLHRREVVFVVGDKVMLSTANLPVPPGRTRKLIPKYYGPYVVRKVNSDVSYELELPPTLKIHPTFHVSQLQPYKDGSTQFPHRVEFVRPDPEVVEEEEEYIVDSIVGKKRGRGGRLFYKVLWKGYPEEEATWEPLTHLTHAMDLVDEYEESLSPAFVLSLCFLGVLLSDSPL
jgi:Chromo (CHRromatin Organisation MOdifier) domain